MWRDAGVGGGRSDAEDEERVVAGGKVAESAAGRERGDQQGRDQEVQDDLTRLTRRYLLTVQRGADVAVTWIGVDLVEKTHRHQFTAGFMAVLHVNLGCPVTLGFLYPLDTVENLSG